MKEFKRVVEEMVPETKKDQELKEALINSAEKFDEEFCKELLISKIKAASTRQELFFYDFLYAHLPSNRFERVIRINEN